MFSFTRSNLCLVTSSLKHFNFNLTSTHVTCLNSYVRAVHMSAINWCQDEMHNNPQNNKPDKILLLDSSDHQIGMMTYVEAQRLAMRKNMKLVKLEDMTKRHKQSVYQLLTGIQLQSERLKQQQLKNEMVQDKQFKGEKTIVIRAKISSHDLETKLKTLQKWIAQGYQVRITIHNDLLESAENIFNDIEKSCKEIDGRVLQKIKANDGSTIKCTAQRNKKVTEGHESSDSDQ